MSTEHSHLHGLIEKLESLSPERVAEVEDFIDFLKSRNQDRQLTHAAMKVAEPSLKRVWDNPEDAIYDAL